MYSRAEYRRRLLAYLAQEREQRERLSGSEKRKATLRIQSCEAELARLDEDHDDSTEGGSSE